MKDLSLSYTVSQYATRLPESKYMFVGLPGKVENAIPLSPEFLAAEAGVFTLMRLDIQAFLR